MAETLLRAAPASRLIATSREPLKAEGEQVYPVPPLGIPADHAEGDDDPLRYGAVRLFLERAHAVAPHFAPDQRQTAIGGDDLPPARRDSAGDRVGRGARSRARR